MAACLRGRSRQELIFGASLAVLALHLAVLAIEGHSIFGRAANPLISLAGIVLLPGVFALFLWQGRIVRTLMAAALSLFAIFVGVGVSVPHLVVARATGSDYTGALFLVAGVVLLGLAFWLGLHGHRLAYIGWLLIVGISMMRVKPKAVAPMLRERELKEAG